MVFTCCTFLYALFLICLHHLPGIHGWEENEAKPRQPHVSRLLFNELEELSRIVDIAYCVGLTGTGIQKPFACASRCQEFDSFELVTTWNTGQLMSDSCGYVALSHQPAARRIIVAFRGTYSIANTIADLSTVPQEYIPFPGSDGDETVDIDISSSDTLRAVKCTNCTVHAGFWRSWQHTKPEIVPLIKGLVEFYPDYQLNLVGHSLGGALAALAALEFRVQGQEVYTTTFGEPRIGNAALATYFDHFMTMEATAGNHNPKYRRVTHVDDPVPLLPLTEWGFEAHGGELYITKSELPPAPSDIYVCRGKADSSCSIGAETGDERPNISQIDGTSAKGSLHDWLNLARAGLAIPTRWRVWQIFFAHRDYFWRLGLCIPGGDSGYRYPLDPEPEL